MKIKIPLIEFQTSKECECCTLKEYEIKLKCAKTKIHSRYITCIAAGIVIWLLASGQANTNQFSEWISFASTVTSIILSVIAIILSITGENKSDSIKNQLEENVKQLNIIAKEMKTINDINKENSEEVSKNIKELGIKISKLPGEVSEAIYKQNTQTEQGWDNEYEQE